MIRLMLNDEEARDLKAILWHDVTVPNALRVAGTLSHAQVDQIEQTIDVLYKRLDAFGVEILA